MTSLRATTLPWWHFFMIAISRRILASVLRIWVMADPDPGGPTRAWGLADAGDFEYKPRRRCFGTRSTILIA